MKTTSDLARNFSRKVNLGRGFFSVKKTKKKYEVKVSKITNYRSKLNTKSKVTKKCAQQNKKKQFHDVKTKPTTEKQTNNSPAFLFETK